METKKNPINVLVVDDRMEIREMMAETLRGAGNFVVEAENAEAALYVMKKLKFDAVITDVDMPGMNGLELAKIIIKDFPQTGIILVTGSHEPDVAQAALEMGIKCIIKPFAMSVLMQNLECVLGKNKSL